MPALKHSKQREAILQFLMTRKDHPTADTVYEYVRKDIPNISLGTVYRNLSLLADNNMILRLTCEGKIDHFDATTTPHYHFYCKQCTQVFDIDMPVIPNIEECAREHFSGKIQGYNLMYTGLCEKCQRK